MKIKCIETIKNYGVFSNYEKGDTKYFGANNIIFGWNYSGKTTLSRIFRSLEKKELHSDFTDGKFKILDEKDNIITESDVPNNSLKVRVFNTDYIKDNLKWEETKDGIPPILIIGDENIKLQKKLVELEKGKKELYNDKKQTDRKMKEKKKALETLISNEARRITNELALGRNFRRPDLESLLDDEDIENWILEDDEFQRKKTETQSSNKLDSVPEVVIKLDETILSNTRTLLSKTVTPSKTIDRLRQDADLEDWVREGRILHKEKQKCEFCGNDLPPDLLYDLDAHFSKDYEDFRKEVEMYIDFLSKKKLIPDLKTKNDFYPELQEDYLNKREELEKEIEKYNASIEEFGKQVKSKVTRLTEKLILDENITLNTEDIKKKTKALNEIIKKNEQKTVDFDRIKQEAVRALKRHYASQFYKDNKIYEKRNEQKKLDDKIKEFSEEIGKTAKKIEEIEGQISESVKGAEALNQFLKLYFGQKSPIEIRVENERFYLYRGENRATNLSEGEKTAISFSYFLTQLNDKDTKDALSETIVFVDDPVSSLDNNHIYNTYAIISIYLKNKCGQLFISHITMFSLIY